jgi:hypothetical protein
MQWPLACLFKLGAALRRWGNAGWSDTIGAGYNRTMSKPWDGGVD